MKEKLVIFGSSGMLGTALLPFLKNFELCTPSSKEVNLLNENEVNNYLSHIKPDKVINISGKIAGLFANLQKPYEYFIENQKMMINVLNSCLQNNVNYLLSCSSTCAYPDVASNYPMKEEQIFESIPSEGNLGYGLAKRDIILAQMLAKKEFGKEYGVIIPSNLYGPKDKHFGFESSHYVTNLLFNLLNNADYVKIGGTGKPLRQFTYVEDVAKAIKLMAENNDCSVLNCATPENLTILEIAEKTLKANNLNHKICFNSDLPDGQYRKDVSSEKLQKKYNFVFTPFDEGIKKTYSWYKENYKHIK